MRNAYSSPVGLRIEVDRNRCMASGNCSMWAGGTFDHDEEGIAIVIDPNGDPEETVQLAATNCPVSAITLFPDGAATST
jgi:ferredoxin